MSKKSIGINGLVIAFLSLGGAAHAAEGQKKSGSETVEDILVTHHQAYRGNIPRAELPQAIQLIDKSTLQDLALTRFQDALDLSASIARQNDGGGLWDSFSLRGFPGNENMPSG